MQCSTLSARWYPWTPNSWLLGVFLSLATCTLPVRAVAVPFSGTITVHDGKLSARVVTVPLGQVMEEISRVSGVKVLWLNGEEREEQVSVEFTNLPLTEGLQRILAKKSFLLFYAATTGEGRPTQIWIASQGSGQPVVITPAVSAAKTISEDEGADSQEQDELASLPLERLMLVAVQDQDPSMREKAITHLEVQARKDQRAISTLTHLAQYDLHPQVQAAATEALSGLE